MMMKTTVFTLVALISQTSFGAAPLCFKDKASYEEVKARLPQALQKTPLILVSNDWKVPAGGIKLDFVEDKLQMSGTYVTALGSYSSASSYVDNVCVQGNNITLRTRGTNYQIAQNGNQFEVTTPDGTATFVTSSASGYASMVQKARGMAGQTGGGYGSRNVASERGGMQ